MLQMLFKKIIKCAFFFSLGEKLDSYAEWSFQPKVRHSGRMLVWHVWDSGLDPLAKSEKEYNVYLKGKEKLLVLMSSHKY